MIKPNFSILIVDDQPDNLRILSLMLAEEGYKVRKALNGETALDAVHALPPDLILLDIIMPHMNGYEVCSALKTSAATREIPVIFLSALSKISDKAQAFAVGGLDYITKPFQVEEVLLRVNHQLAIRSQQQKLIEQNYRPQRDIAEQQRAELQKQVQRCTADLQQALDVSRQLHFSFASTFNNSSSIHPKRLSMSILSQAAIGRSRCVSRLLERLNFSRAQRTEN